MSMLSRVNDTVTTPFVGTLDLKHLFLLVGLVIVFAGFWAFIIAHLRVAASEVLE